jgi:hypothetical protein
VTRFKALCMALFIAVLVLVLVRFDKDKPQDLASTEPISIVSGISPHEVQEVSLIGALGILKMKRSDDSTSWVLKEPEGAAVDPDFALLMLESIFALHPENIIDPKEVSQDQSIYGLTPPELVLRIKGEFGSRVLSFGKRNLISGGRYAQAEGDAAIYLVEEEHFTVLNKSPSEVRQRSILQVKPENIESVVARGSNFQAFILKKEQKTKQDVPSWFLTVDGRQFRADGDAVRKALLNLVSAEAQEFVDGAGDKLPFYGLAKPLVTLRLGISSESPSEKLVAPIVTMFGKGLGKNISEVANGELGSAYYQKLANDPWVYRVERKTLASWLQGAQQFRDRVPFALISEPDIQSISIKCEGKEYRFQRESLDAKWESDQREKNSKDFQAFDAAPGTLNEWLEKMFSLRVLTYDDGASKQVTSQPFLEISFTLFKSDANISSGRLIIGNQLQGTGLSDQNLASSPRHALIELSFEQQAGMEEASQVVLSGDIVDRLHVAPNFFTKGE